MWGRGVIKQEWRSIHIRTGGGVCAVVCDDEVLECLVVAYVCLSWYVLDWRALVRSIKWLRLNL